jgi:adenylyltransferase/sulfurtransferase
MTESKELYFKRQIELWGKNTQNNLSTKSILIIGCGGLGCGLAMALGAIGLGCIDLVDFDKVTLHNIHRQIGFILADKDKYKAKSLKKLIESKSTYTKVNAYTIDFDTFISVKFNEQKYDLILDATDNLPIRAKINNFAKSINCRWIYASVEEFHGQVCFFHNANFEEVFKITNKKPAGIAAPIVMQVASFEANIAIRYLAGLKVTKDKLYYCFYDKCGDFIIQKFNL